MENLYINEKNTPLTGSPAGFFGYGAVRFGFDRLLFNGFFVNFRFFTEFEKFLFDVGFFRRQEVPKDFVSPFQRKKRQSGKQNQPADKNDQEIEKLESEQGAGGRGWGIVST